MNEKKTIRIAVLDLYNGAENQGMRCIREILTNCDYRFHGVSIGFDVFDVRCRDEVPDLGYDGYISSGGPGSPFDGEGSEWERKYFSWMDQIWNHNQIQASKKFLLSICHSFQLLSRHFDLAEVVPRKSGSFGILPVHLTETGTSDLIFNNFPDPFYAADFREWQVLQPNTKSLRSLGASILAIEKERPHVPLERAVMAVRVSPEIVGTQFHPEADPEGMYYHFMKDEQRLKIIDNHGPEKFAQIIHRLKDPNYLLPTYQNFIPSFLRMIAEHAHAGHQEKVVY